MHLPASRHRRLLLAIGFLALTPLLRLDGAEAQRARPLPPAVGMDAGPPAPIAGLDARPVTPLEFSRGWLGKTEEVRRRRAELQATGQLDGMEPVALARTGAALSGLLRVPVIPVHYADVGAPFPSTVLADRLFGKSNRDTLSYADYWREVSGGLLRVEGEVTSWVPLVNRAQHYLEAGGYGWAKFGRIMELRAEALGAVDRGLDFGRFDNDGPDGISNSGDDDGYVDFVAFVYALDCRGDWKSGAIWPHRGAMAPYETDDRRANGGRIKISDYVIQPAVEPGTCAPMHVGVLAHETAHAFGLPDLYDYDGTSQGIGAWGLMGTGSHSARFSPAHPSAWEKEQLGWVRVDWLRGDAASLRLPPVEASRRVFRYDIPQRRGEYLLLENRQRLGSDKYLPGGGMLVWRVDPDRGELGAWNSDERRPAVLLLEADGKQDLTRGINADAGDPFPGRAARRDLDLPLPLPFRLSAVREDDEDIVFDLSLKRIGRPVEISTEVVRLTAPHGERPLPVSVSIRSQAVAWLAASGPSFDVPLRWEARGRTRWIRLESKGDTLLVGADATGLPFGPYADTVEIRLVGEKRVAARIAVQLSAAPIAGTEVIATGLPWSWGLAVHQGEILQASYGWDPLGLRPRPRLLHLWDSQAHPETLARIPSEALHAPVRTRDGSTYVLARAGGENYLYRIGEQGDATVVATRLGRAPAYGAAPLPDGSLVVGDWDGRIRRVTPDGKVQAWAHLNARLYQIATDSSGTIFAATYRGDVIRVDHRGEGIILQTGFGAGRLVAVAASRGGDAFAAERGGMGRILRLSPDGSRSVVAQVRNAAFYGLAVDDRFLYALDLEHRQLLRVPLGSGGSPSMLAGAPRPQRDTSSNE